MREIRMLFGRRSRVRGFVQEASGRPEEGSLVSARVVQAPEVGSRISARPLVGLCGVPRYVSKRSLQSQPLVRGEEQVALTVASLGPVRPRE